MEICSILALVCPDGRHLANFIHSWFGFKFYDCMFLPGLWGGNVGDSMTNDSVILALQFDFSVPVGTLMLGFVSMTELVCVMLIPFLGHHGIPHLGIVTLTIIVVNFCY